MRCRLPFLGRALLLTLLPGVPMTATAATRIESRPFGNAPGGGAAELFTLHRGALTVAVTNWGGHVVSIRVPDREGRIADVALGHPDAEGYFKDTAFLGALVGRYANRIARGEFSLGGKTYSLARNNGPNSLHGGPGGFHNRLWRARFVTGADGDALELPT